MATPPSPHRRFMPQPVETTSKSKSNRKNLAEPAESATAGSAMPDASQADTTASKPRRFAPEPIETTTKSSRTQPGKDIEANAKSTRKFVPEPAETVTRSFRRVVPEPVDTSTRNSKTRRNEDLGRDTTRRFRPQLFETSSSSHYGSASHQQRTGGEPDIPEESSSEASVEKAQKPVGRRFAPQLVETVKRRRKSGDECPAVLPSDKTEITPGDVEHVSKRSTTAASPTVPERSLVTAPSDAKDLFKPHRQSSMRPHNNSRASTRGYSFRVPDLDPIDSSESDRNVSDASEVPSPRSPSSSSDFSDLKRRPPMPRDSADEGLEGYLLSVAAQAAEKQLREQAMAAFPNDDHHEGPAHYVDDDSDEEDDDLDAENQVQLFSHEKLFPHEKLGMTQRDGWDSNSEEELAMQEMRQYRERSSRNEKGRTGASKGQEQFSKLSLIAALHPGTDASGGPSNIIGGWQRNVGLAQMRKAASPPMLGGDIAFPRCPSPESARFDVMHGSTHLRNNMCYLTEQTQQDDGGLWQGKGGGRSTGPSAAGLWMGFCAGKSTTSLSMGPSGIVTPKHRGTLTAGNATAGIEPRTKTPLPPSPPDSTFSSAIEETKEDENGDELGQEIDDALVTQVYNYLSLGYPSLARKYDEELSRITNVPVEDLRRDDRLASGARGYILLGDEPGFPDPEPRRDGHRGGGMWEQAGGDGGKGGEEMCWRWKALKLYVEEWARQQPGMKYEGNAMGAWGIAARRGSWLN